ncbi:extracellular solute-binding protein [Roseomonas sp. HJA6]|uniref:Extracellular solute-binding protein n=1 Tax=Roseomonas alba TaxID=2846776 RepID=A0ABS7AFL6_9PROT|nr:extracellular solute-binding protein [Neoroseomonas alba]MBW6400860.1 extracellular solute-binding protein [Neoroseomonas alba]
MRILRRLCLVAPMLALAALPARAEERLVIAGRDAAFGDALSRMVEAYQARNPGLRIERLELPGGALYERIAVNARERTKALDVLMLDDIWAPEFMANGWLANLDTLGGVPGDFVGPADAVSRGANGQRLAAPMVGNVAMFAYRADLFRAAGLPAPTTFTAVAAAARTLRERDPGITPIAFRGVRGNPIVTGFMPVLGAFGGAVVDAQGRAALDSPAALAALEYFLSLKPYLPRGVETWNATEVREAMEQGRVAIALEFWPGWAGTLDDAARSRVVGQVTLVAPPGERSGPAPMLGAWLLGVAADSPNAARAADFIRFVVSAENQKRIALETGNPPTLAALYNDPELVQRFRWYPAQLAALQAAQPRPRITQWNRVEAILGEQLQIALVGQATPAEALREANRQIQRALAR